MFWRLPHCEGSLPWVQNQSLLRALGARVIIQIAQQAQTHKLIISRQGAEMGTYLPGTITYMTECWYSEERESGTSSSPRLVPVEAIRFGVVVVWFGRHWNLYFILQSVNAI